MPQGMVDVKFADSGRVERRQENLLSRARKNPRRSRKARRNAESPGLDADVKGAVKSGGGLTVFTRPDPPRLSPPSKGMREYCGNPIDGTAYYAVIDNAARSTPRWVTWAQVGAYLPEELKSALINAGKKGPILASSSLYGDAVEALNDYKKAASTTYGSRFYPVKILPSQLIRQRKGKRGQRALKEHERPRGTSKRGKRATGEPPPSNAFGIQTLDYAPPIRGERKVEKVIEYYKVATSGAPAKDRLQKFSVYGQKWFSAASPERARSESYQKYGIFSEIVAVSSDYQVSPATARMLIYSGAVGVQASGQRGVKRIVDPSYQDVQVGDKIRIYLGKKNSSPFFSWVKTTTSPFIQTSKGYPDCLPRDNLKLRQYISRGKSALQTYASALRGVQGVFRGFSDGDRLPSRATPSFSLAALARGYSAILGWWMNVEDEADFTVPAAKAQQVFSYLGLGNPSSPLGESLQSLRGTFVTETGLESTTKSPKEITRAFEILGQLEIQSPLISPQLGSLNYTFPPGALKTWSEADDKLWAVQMLSSQREGMEGWGKEDEETWKYQMYFLTFAYYELGGYDLIGPLNPNVRRKGSLSKMIQRAEKEEAVALGGEVSLNQSKLGVTTYITYNPILFEVTRLFWRSDSFTLLQHSQLVQNIDTTGRYGIALRMIQTGSLFNTDEHGVRLYLEELLEPAAGKATHIMTRTKDDTYAPFLLFWPLGYERKAAVEAANQLVFYPMETLRNLKHEVTRATASALAIRARDIELPGTAVQERHTPFVFTRRDKHGIAKEPIEKSSILSRAGERRSELVRLLDKVNKEIAKALRPSRKKG